MPSSARQAAAGTDESEAADETDRAGFSVTLLDGVTGAGKTEVYLEAVAEAVEAGRQVLVLLPEIALTAQWLERFRRRFGAAPAEWHSDLSQRQRRIAWRAVAEGEALLDSAIALKMMEEFRRLQGDPVGADGITQLTERELAILRLVAQVLDNVEICDRLGLSEKTIRNRLTTIFEKLHVNNRIQAALYALRQGLASLDDDQT